MDDMKVNELCLRLRTMLQELDGTYYTQSTMLEIMLDEAERAKLDDALCICKGFVGKQFRKAQDPQRRAQLLDETARYLEAQTLIREIAEELSAD